jgi:hypothetical protein
MPILPKKVSNGIIILIDPSFTTGLIIVISSDSIIYDGNLDADKESRVGLDITGEITLSLAEYNELIQDLKLPTAFPKWTSGLDGETYTVSIVNGTTKATFIWWVECPEGWESLNIFVHKVIEYIRQKHSVKIS